MTDWCNQKRTLSHRTPECGRPSPFGHSPSHRDGQSPHLRRSSGRCKTPQAVGETEVVAVAQHGSCRRCDLPQHVADLEGTHRHRHQGTLRWILRISHPTESSETSPKVRPNPVVSAKRLLIAVPSSKRSQRSCHSTKVSCTGSISGPWRVCGT